MQAATVIGVILASASIWAIVQANQPGGSAYVPQSRVIVTMSEGCSNLRKVQQMGTLADSWVDTLSKKEQRAMLECASGLDPNRFTVTIVGPSNSRDEADVLGDLQKNYSDPKVITLEHQ